MEDRSFPDTDTETVRVQFENGPVFRVSKGLSLREIVAHLLTPGLDEELESTLEELHSAAERQAKNGVEPDFTVLLDGEPADFDTTIDSEGLTQIRILKDAD
ncbi:hypothetical protein [Haloferax volcanii]|uniref:Uncharacterized protein n=1 Tax=Haloferax volcanii TaxID=2246 RepID=A0A8T5CGM0_HALVO|nr:hypothetical protein [Haloferax volcanii]MBS8120599.1 hypothetical protein [Haloferax volcanii]MBS8125636.1 hypothetical protein [Haloferax volcanii]MBS8129645.1 hypothetical protein [Haloferax volcanii]MBS8133510.1 hypothetical protein [Haloferax volcanii]MDW7538383.1 hypothetical protein [Haloferax volcanii]